MKHFSLVMVSSAVIAVGAASFADGHAKVPGEIVARHGVMNIMSLNMAVVGGMARGNTDYDAAAAQDAADSLAAVGMIKQTLLWPEGTSSEDTEISRALPAIWSDRAGFDAKWADYTEATANLKAAAGQGLDALRPAVGAVGGTCGGCHDDYRQPR